VNRGFVPTAFKDPATRPSSLVKGTVEVVGVLREGGRVIFIFLDNLLLLF